MIIRDWISAFGFEWMEDSDITNLGKTRPAKWGR